MRTGDLFLPWSNPLNRKISKFVVISIYYVFSILATLDQNNTACLDIHNNVTDCRSVYGTTFTPEDATIYQTCYKYASTEGPQSGFCWVLDPGCPYAFKWLPRYLEFVRDEITNVSYNHKVSDWVADHDISYGLPIWHSLYHVRFTGPVGYSGLEVLLTDANNDSNCYGLGGMSYNMQPTGAPSRTPTVTPTHKPTHKPTPLPTSKPTSTPSLQPLNVPTTPAPSFQPTVDPTLSPATACDCIDFCAANPGVNTTHDNSWGHWSDGLPDDCVCICPPAPTGQPSNTPTLCDHAYAPQPMSEGNGTAPAPFGGGNAPVPTSTNQPPVTVGAGPSAPSSGVSSQLNTDSVSSSNNALQDPTTSGIIIFFIIAGALAIIAAAYFAYRAVRGNDPKLARMRAAGRMSQDGQVVPSHGDAIDLSSEDAFYA